MSEFGVTRVGPNSQPQQNRPSDGPGYTPDEILIMFKAGVDFDPAGLQTNSPQLNSLLRRLNINGGEKLHKSKPKSNNSNAEGVDRMFRIKLPKGSDISRIARELKSNPNVQFAEPNYIVRACATPDDTLLGSQTYLDIIKAPQAWDITTGDPALIFGIADTGFDYPAADFAGRLHVNLAEPIDLVDNEPDGYVDNRFGWNFVGNNNNASDDNGHGTTVAGIIGAATNNTFGVAGLTWQGKMMPVKCLDSSGTADIAACVAAITYAVDHGVDIINCSWGGYGFSLALLTSVNYALAANRIVVAAAGNDGVEAPFYPAAFHGIISAGATDQNDLVTSFSNHGEKRMLFAPGVDIFTIAAGGGFGSVTGTSPSAAILAAVAGLVKSKYPAYTNSQVYQKMYTTAVTLSAGERRIDAYAALQGPDPLTSSMATPLDESTVSGTINITGSSNGSDFQQYSIEWGIGGNPSTWSNAGISLANGGTVAVTNGQLATFDTAQVPAGTAFTIRLTSMNSIGGIFYDYIRLNMQPSPIVSGVVNDGTGADIDYQTSLSDLSANWTGFIDSNPGIATITEYQYAVGTTPGGTDIIGWTSAGLSNNFTQTGLSLVQGTKYYTTVRAINNKGENVDVCSDGVTIDTTPPAGSVNDGTGADVDYAAGTSLAANWAVADPESAITKFEYSIGTAPGGTQLQSWTDAGLATSFNLAGLSLVEGQTYYTNVRALNGAGVTSVISSDGVTIIPSLLSAPAYVNDGTGSDIDVQADLNGLSANWPSVPDAFKYWYAIGTTPGGTDAAGWTDNGSATGASKSLTLANGQNYYVSVRAENALGMPGAIRTSDGVLGDTTPPAGGVNDGTGADVDYAAGTSLAANWSIADPESTITKFEYSIGTAPGGTQLQSWTDVGLSTSFNLTGLGLIDGQTYYTNVRATNGAGSTSVLSSNGVKVIPAVLAAPSYVNDGMGADIDWQLGLIGLSANWGAVPDAFKYWYAIGTTPGGTDVVGWTDNGSAIGASKSLTLTNGQNYYVSVRAENPLGMLGAIKTSDGVLADTTSPAGGVNDGTGADIDQQDSANSLSANWNITDAESGIANFAYSIGTSPAGTDVVGWTDAGAATNFNLTGLNLVPGQTYYTNVRAANNAGLIGTFSSDGIRIKVPSVPIRIIPAEFKAFIKPNPFVLSRGKAKIQVEMPVEGRLTVQIYSVDNYHVAGLVSEQQRSAGIHEIEWDGTSTQGQKVSEGIYLGAVIVNDQSGRRLFTKKVKIAVTK